MEKKKLDGVEGEGGMVIGAISRVLSQRDSVLKEEKHR